ncbi:type I phosphomannose isomerase catalytic subunit [Nonlabens marinus]|uniref:Mannose-6-phosphate isomerase n=1 Tax=Nonlabens marinus S1-08 TaxID=1454201 RepID=W8VR78_9FLAO|nr:type I phosphomannose isomerase catalytic subunit [Nonlabens marinus]BAO55495.1 mannose-6-phosphate isomerase [Nonlabens marinus S1-08]
MNWYPLTFQPFYKEKIWGGTQLNSLKQIHPPLSNIGESWEISDVGDDISKVLQGPLENKSLRWILENYGEEVMGTRVSQRFGTQFPILIKYINTAQDLSIQLHPDDKMAMAKHNSFGKTEMWYVMNSNPEAGLTLGFKEATDEFAFAKAIQNNSLPALLNFQEAQRGDSFLIKPGFVHAIGAGITLAEIQQSSDLTYRVHDYNRLDDAGNPRELHVEEAIAAADYSQATDHQIHYDRELSGRQNLAETDYFETDILQFSGTTDVKLVPEESFTILMNVGDSCKIKHEGTSYSFKHAQTYLIPAAIKELDVTCDGSGKLLLVHL